ncbi:MAG: hypothetical protein QNJ84_12140 [Alphaproteobacteria bacterium]|nr:hypothetical protein [Alphaproteobacteria bacterium]
MDKIDQALAKAISDQPLEPVPVLIACRHDCAKLAKRLQSLGLSGFHVIAELNIISVTVAPDILPQIDADSEVSSIELDSEVRLD